MKIRRDDVVMVRSGADAGKTGKVLQVLPERGRLLVEGVNLVKKAIRKSDANPQGGFAEKEAPIHASKVQLYDPESKRGVRVAIDRSSGKRVRKSRQSAHVFD